jgi:hypothetical protein
MRPVSSSTACWATQVIISDAPVSISLGMVRLDEPMAWADSIRSATWGFVANLLWRCQQGVYNGKVPQYRTLHRIEDINRRAAPQRASIPRDVAVLEPGSYRRSGGRWYSRRKTRNGWHLWKMLPTLIVNTRKRYSGRHISESTAKSSALGVGK